MRSQVLGKNTSVEVVQISPHGIWLHATGYEYFLSYKDYPWFKKATVDQIYRVELLHGHHLFWPTLDVDLELESLTHPGQYPLKYKVLQEK